MLTQLPAQWRYCMTNCKVTASYTKAQCSSSGAKCASEWQGAAEHAMLQWLGCNTVISYIAYLVVKRQRALESNILSTHTGYHSKPLGPCTRSRSFGIQLQLFHSLREATYSSHIAHVVSAYLYDDLKFCKPATCLQRSMQVTQLLLSRREMIVL